MEPVLAKAARKLGIDQVAIRRINAPEGKAPVRPAERPSGQRYVPTSAFVKEALDKGAELFNWDERKAQSGKRNGIEGARRRRGGEHLRRRLDRLRRPVRHQARRPAVHPVGHRQSRHRVGQRLRTASRPRCSACRGRRWTSSGATRQEPAVDAASSGGSQTIHAHDPRGARGGDGRDQEAAGDRGARRSAAARSSYKVANERVCRAAAAA